MNWFIDKTTHGERVTIETAVGSLFADLEKAECLLGAVLDDHFNNREQEALSGATADYVGTMLRIVLDILSDTILAYSLTVADVYSVRAKRFIESADAVKRAMQCEAANNAACDVERKLPADESRQFIEERIRICDLEDAEAIMALNDLVKNGGKNG